MKTITSIKEMQKTIQTKKHHGKNLGFVPTMGFLHDGHFSLITKAKNESDLVVVSIFVNPLQFGPNEDYDKYPRDYKKDEDVLSEMGVDILFYPEVTEMYPQESTVEVKVQQRVDVLCGKSRPGHFDGVATVLTKLFQIIFPDRVYFGMKDAQQVAVVDGLITDFNFPMALVACPIVREADGLAKSSRNVRLSQKERSEAVFINKSLQIGKEAVKNGERNTDKMCQLIENYLNETIKTGTIDYVEVLSYPGLQNVSQLEPEGEIIIAVAVQFASARLIDNVVFTV